MAITAAGKRPLAWGIGMTLAVLGLCATGPAQAAPGRHATPDHLTLGLGVAARPQYQGADDYDATFVPLINAKLGRFFIRNGDGIGMNVITGNHFTAGAALKLMRGYDSDDVPAGIDELDREVGARLFIKSNLNGAIGTLSATQAISDSDRGLLLEANLQYPMAISHRLVLTPGIGTTWASEDYMGSYFGISSHEAAASGLDRYSPDSGFKDIYARLRARYRLTERVNVLGSVGLTHLVGEAADSPLVEQDTQLVSFVGLAYTF